MYESLALALSSDVIHYWSGHRSLLVECKQTTVWSQYWSVNLFNGAGRVVASLPVSQSLCLSPSFPLFASPFLCYWGCAVFCFSFSGINSRYWQLELTRLLNPDTQPVFGLCGFHCGIWFGSFQSAPSFGEMSECPSQGSPLSMLT